MAILPVARSVTTGEQRVPIGWGSTHPVFHSYRNSESGYLGTSPFTERGAPMNPTPLVSGA